jgi:hypothetical protein
MVEILEEKEKIDHSLITKLAISIYKQMLGLFGYNK